MINEKTIHDILNDFYMPIIKIEIRDEVERCLQESQIMQSDKTYSNELMTRAERMNDRTERHILANKALYERVKELDPAFADRYHILKGFGLHD